jgi:integrase
MPVLEKIGIDYRPPIQTRHTFATLMLSAGEDIGWVRNMMGHSSLQMIFERYYAWIPKPTRLDGQAFTRYAENTIDKTSQKAMSTEIEPEKPTPVPVVREWGGRAFSLSR